MDLLENRNRRIRAELREQAIAVASGMGGSEAIDEALPLLPEANDALQQEGFETAHWWPTGVVED